MGLAIVVALALLANKSIKHAKASPIPDDRNTRLCTSFTVPVPITAHNHIFDVVHVDSNIEAVHFSQDLDTWDSPSFADRIIKNITISKTYDIHAQLCIPPNGSKKSYLQLATHGGAFDGRYWDSEVEPKKHSYVDAALEAGYSILTYDRLACGQSSKPDAYTEVQAPAEVEVLRGLSKMVRSGEISSYASDSGFSFDKIIHIGHSYGSFVTYALTVTYPDLSDAAVLTGFILNKELYSETQTAKDYEYAPENDPKLFADSSSGYVVQGTRSAIQTGFFSSRANESTGIGGFDPSTLDYAYSLRQPTAVTELSSPAVLLPDILAAQEYTGPVQVMLGEFDFLVCGGDCRDTYNATQVREMYPKAKGVGIYLQPGTGHALPFHHGARLGFEATFDWLSENGF